MAVGPDVKSSATVPLETIVAVVKLVQVRLTQWALLRVPFVVSR